MATIQIETARLLLRHLVESDLDAVFAYQSRSDVARYLYWGPRSRHDVQRSLSQRIAADWPESDGEVLSLAVVRRDSGELIGDVALFLVSAEHRQGEIGYVFHPNHQGQGFAQEAARELLRFGFDELGLHRIVGRLDARNEASGRVLARLGMRREAHFRQNEFVKGEWADEVVYAILAAEWRTEAVGAS
jgi:RimJ/RimL family protein N-acetyltransferase